MRWWSFDCSDLALALCLDAQQIARPDLRIGVMSATLGGGLAERVASIMATAGDGVLSDASGDGGARGGAKSVPIIVSEGRSYPVGENVLLCTHFHTSPVFLMYRCTVSGISRCG